MTAPRGSDALSFGRAFRIAAVGLGAVALVMGVICGLSVHRNREFLAVSSTAPGEVIGLVSRESCDEDDEGRAYNCHLVYAPRVRFTAADGREIVFESSTASSPASYAEGDRVEVRYRPDRPADARIDAVMDVWLDTIVTGFIALGFTAGFVVFVVLAVRFRLE
jgi:hypothetical protein